jgi:hypothetical protein
MGNWKRAGVPESAWLLVGQCVEVRSRRLPIMGTIWQTRLLNVKEMMTPKGDSKTGLRTGLDFLAFGFRPETHPF